MIQQFLSKCKDKGGFTLIELLVVIAIIGTLSTIGFIALTSSQEGAQDSVKISEVRSIQSAIQIWSAASGTAVFPTTTASAGTCEKLSAGFASNTGLQYAIGSEISGIDWDSNDYFYCAGDQTAGNVWYVIGAKDIKNEDNAVLENDLDGDAGGKITADYASVIAAEVCGVSQGSGQGDTAGKAVYCLGVGT